MKGPVCWLWYSTDPVKWQRSPFFQYPLCRVHHWVMLDHNISAPAYWQSNSKTKVTVKFAKGLLTQFKCAGDDPYLALLTYWGIPVDVHLWSPGDLLYQYMLHTTMSQCNHHIDPHATADHDFYISVPSRVQHTMINEVAKKSHHYSLDRLCAFWITPEACGNCHCHVWIDYGSHIAKVTGVQQYWCACDHNCKCHPGAVKPNAHVTTDVASVTSTP